MTNKDHTAFGNVSNRGKESSHLIPFVNSMIGFHRLAIVDPTSTADQPYTYETKDYKYIMVCNGEIYNYKELYRSYLHGEVMKSHCDCEVLFRILIQMDIGILSSLPTLRGVYACVFGRYNKHTHQETYYIFRDTYGLRPIYYGITPGCKQIYISSELRGIPEDVLTHTQIYQLPGSSVMTVNREGNMFDVRSRWIRLKTGFSPFLITGKNFIYNCIRGCLIDSVSLRCHADRPICCLLSGGLDSSLIASILAGILKQHGKILHTFTIASGSDSADVEYADMVAKHIGSVHTHIRISQEEALQAIEPVIYNLGSYDVTTVRASVWQYLACKYISEHTNYKVVFCGDGSDEVHGSYLYLQKAPNSVDFAQESEFLLNNIYHFDVRRADGATACHNLELRAPFLDHQYCRMYLAIDENIRNTRPEKLLLRQAFDRVDPMTNKAYLPDEVLWRQKDAFSDSTTSHSQPWYKTVQSHIDTLITNEEFIDMKDSFTHLPPVTKEAYYYRKVFESMYPGQGTVLPYYWMPKWVNVENGEPSARAIQD